ncbi:hypothetical protein B0I35DRAFT_405334 [Stachybotrys elegans]|uniref:AHC1-like C2H2 zinc-finger domain-containing protein n=1 Tax=Stachybotrys elegans TaxID=80388 RepID=A0A8K0SYD9_9HYPO|nr:hypothetical protein B0I35DRAFT_405334 [Stachybotrys elegans]
MLMFRLLGYDSRGSEKTVDAPVPVVLSAPKCHGLPSPCDAITTSFAPPQPLTKRRLSCASYDDPSNLASQAKKAKLSKCDDVKVSPPSPRDTKPTADAWNTARDAIQHEFCTEILYKHNELRLINQELAKCQAALEQLRRCHLIPYPVNCPTPEQMLAISSGKGPALQTVPGEPVPRWAPPFGVVDGPYARHYSKWLIPDPSFDGIQLEWQFAPDAYRGRNAALEGRTTRNSFAEPASAVKGRAGRGLGSQKLQALSSGYPQPKEKAGPCILKRSDGQTVKLVCLDCNRENFSSTQGFINHCRIAHKRDFKSHEEAAVHSGHPIDVAENANAGNTPVEEKPSSAPPSTATSAMVHPFARPDMTDQQAYSALRSRISESLKLYQQGKLSGVTSIPSKPPKTQEEASVTRGPDRFRPATETPYLSQLMKRRKFNGNLQDVVTEAKKQVSLEDITPGEESDDMDAHLPSLNVNGNVAPPARTPVVMRVPARSAKSPAPTDSSARPGSSNKGRLVHMSIVSPPNSGMGLLPKQGSNPILSDEDLDMEDANLSPHTIISNNAPSLVSDDGEYDDSDEGSSVSGDNDSLDAESVSDVAEISLDDEHDARGLRRGSSSLRKDEAKHVTFINPAKNARPRKI